MSPQKTGFLISGIVHLGLLFIIFFTVAFHSPPKNKKQDVILAVSLDMLAPQPEPIPEIIEQDSTPEMTPIIPEPKNNISEAPEEKIKPQPVLDVIPQSKQPSIHQLAHSDDSEDILLQAETDPTYLRLLEQQYSEALKQAINANKFYPSQARRRSREGDVVVGFKISRHGDIKNIHIVRSSSIRILDKAAIRAVHNVGKFKPIPSDIIRNWWEFEILLSYNLL